jgi:hypothetical protein
MARELERTARTLVAVAALLLLPLAAFGQAVSCPLATPDADFDSDGLSDWHECWGLPLLPGLSVVDPVTGGMTDIVPSCFGNLFPRELCLRAEEADVFVMMVPAVPSGLPPNLFEPISAPSAEGGLGVVAHQVFGDNPDGSRLVSPVTDQNAVQVTEFLDTEGDVLGIANYGTPQNLDRARIYTQRIANFVASKCPPDPSLCVTDRGASGIAAVTEELALWVANHEVGHTFKLTAEFNKRFGGYHLKAGSDFMMEQFVTWNESKKTGKVTFCIPGTGSHALSSVADKQLILP